MTTAPLTFLTNPGKAPLMDALTGTLTKAPSKWAEPEQSTDRGAKAGGQRVHERGHLLEGEAGDALVGGHEVTFRGGAGSGWRGRARGARRRAHGALRGRRRCVREDSLELVGEGQSGARPKTSGFAMATSMIALFILLRSSSEPSQYRAFRECGISPFGGCNPAALSPALSLCNPPLRPGYPTKINMAIDNKFTACQVILPGRGRQRRQDAFTARHLRIFLDCRHRLH